MRVDGTGTGTGTVSVTKSLVKNAPGTSLSDTYTATGNNTVNTVNTGLSFPTVTVGSQSGITGGTLTYNLDFDSGFYGDSGFWSGKENVIFNSYGGKEFSLGSGSPAKDKGDNSLYPLSSTGLGSDAAAKTEAAAYFNTTHSLNLPDAALEQLGKALRKDAAGNPRRPLAETIDMGAFEF
jgi:hypothetical protein